ncbi:pseudouridine synthase [Pseudoalteromonas sp. SSM20]|uniref:pseudouridine synthase n=1 Tax=Pseudoalteromonas sp. SSM20 TaxID=3139394 RepID=UPI003BACFD85
MVLNIIYSCEDFYVVEKPHNVSFHSEEGVGFFASFEKQVNESLFPVHRLDKMTSGLVLVARNKQAATEFGEMFSQKQQGNISKYYVSIATGKPTKKQGWVKGDLVKSRRGCYKLQKTTENPSITRFVSCLISPGLRLYLLQPITGKTHQLRVVHKSLAVPILGDERYGADASERGYLHAFALKFNFKGTDYSFLNMPKTGLYQQPEVISLIEQWQQPWHVFN